MSRMSIATTRPFGADPPRGDLAPAAGRGAEIDHACSGLEQTIFVVDLGKLVRGARAKSLALGARHVRIADLAFEPGPRRRRPALLPFEPCHDPSGFAPDAVGAHHLDQHAFAQAAIGDAQARARERRGEWRRGWRSRRAPGRRARRRCRDWPHVRRSSCPSAARPRAKPRRRTASSRRRAGGRSA